MANRKKRKRLFRRLRQKTPHMKYIYGWFFKHAAIKENTVLIESFHGKTIGDSGLAFAREISRTYPSEYKVYYATNDIKAHRPLAKQLGLDAELVDISTFKYCRVLATAEHIISNASLPIYYIRKDGQSYLQTWHGTPLKTLGKKMREGIESMYNVQHNFLQASYITFPNEFTRKAIMEDYNLERLYTGTVVMAGYPRNTVFLADGDSKALREQLGIQDKTVYAYMPTWRGRNNQEIDNTDYLNEVGGIFRKLDDAMRDDQVMYVNFHPILKNSIAFDDYKHICAFPQGIDSYEFLNCVDALVTDYSSVFFDFSLTRKPIVLFMYDYDDYMAERGMYMDVADLPFRQIHDVDEFCSCIAEDACLGDRYDDSDYFRKFFKYDSPDITRRLLDLLFKQKNDGLETESYAKNSENPVNVYFPKRAYAESDFRTLARAASGPDDIVMMYRRWFKGGVGQLLHDEFNDKFNYVITTNTVPRTYLEQLLFKLGSKKNGQIIRQRDFRRSLPGLTVNGDYIRNFGFLEKGYRADLQEAVVLESEVSSGADGVITFTASVPQDLDIREAVILDNYRAIVDERTLGQDEKDSSSFRFDLKECIESLAVYRKENAVPGLIATDRDGERKLILFGDSKRSAEAAELIKKKRRTGLSYIPAPVTCSLPADYARNNLRIIMNSHDESVRGSISSYNLDLCETKLYVTPFMSFRLADGIIGLHVDNEPNTISFMSDPAVFRGCSLDSKGLRVRAFMPGWKAENVTGAALILDSQSEDVRIPLETEVTEERGGCSVSMKLDYYDGIPLTPIRWHCRIAVDVGGETHYMKIRVQGKRQLRRFKLGTIQSEMADGNILFPYAGKGNIFKLCYREKSAYDEADTRVREVAALALRKVLRRYYRSKGIFLIYEKFCQTAQDNSYYFFKYCMENLSGAERDRFYYVIDKNAADYSKVSEYDDHVIQFMSIKHMLYAMTARLCISTDSLTHLYVWQSKPSYVYDRIHRKRILFLQHGVTALKRVDSLFGKKGSSPMTYFVTTSDTEQDIVVREFGYAQKNAPITGFARWDVLEDKKSADDRMILVMPTWRQWLEDTDDETFLRSDYFENYKQLLTDSRLDSMLTENNVRLVLYLHPKFAGYMDAFRQNISEKIECVRFGEKPLNDIMMHCHMLITDYSSVCWDVLYMDKPVVFYHFDSDEYLRVHGSYINFDTDLPGPRETECEGVLDQIAYYIDNGFTLRDEHREMIPQYFKYRDSSNCERTYQFLTSRYSQN